MSDASSPTASGAASTRARDGGLASLGEGLRIAVDALRANRVRALLTILGVAVGVAVVVTMAALITGIRSSLFSAFEAAGPNNLIVTRFDFTAARADDGDDDAEPWWTRPEITPREATRVATLPGIDEALYNVGFAITISYEGQRIPGIQSQGYSSGWPRYSVGDFVAGRDFTEAEVRQARSVVVLSAELAEALFGGRDPIGRRVRASSPFRNVQEDFAVVGVYRPEENLFTALVQHWAVFPYTTALKRLKAPDGQAQILVVPEDTVSRATAEDRVVGLMRGLRGLGPREQNDFAVLASARIAETLDQLAFVFFVVMLGLSSAGLMVGGVGVIGIMLISVTERTREIGIRKAVGATRREILWQFLIEAGLLTTVGGAVGMALGAGFASVVERFTPIPAAIPLWSVAAALAMAGITGVVFGLLPAYRAARMEPVEALRAE